MAKASLCGSEDRGFKSRRSPQHNMNEEFITIAEAAALLGKDDTAVMRLMKDRLRSSGLSLEAVVQKRQTEKGFLYLLSKEFLFGEPRTHTPPPAPAREEPQLIQAKNEMIAALTKIIETKDRHIEDLSKKIDSLIERDRETNILMKGLQDRIFLLEAKKDKTKTP